MKLVFALGCCLGLIAAAAAQTSDDAPKVLPALHPTSIVTTYDGKSYDVEGVSDTVPQILLNGKLKYMPSGSGYAPQRAKAYAPGYVAFKSQKASNQKLSITLMFEDTGLTTAPTIKDLGTDYVATIQPEQAIPDAYLVLLFFNRSFSRDSTTAPAASLVFQHIGTIPGGQPTRIEADFGALDKKAAPYTYFPMIFSHGAEVRSNLYEQEAVFFRRLDLMVHDQMLAAYRQKFSAGDHPVVPAVRFEPIIPTAKIAAALPAVVHVSCTVTDRGLVDNISVEEPLPAAALRPIVRSVGGLMFFPRLVDGQPVSTPIQFPLRFGAATPAAN